MKPMRPDHAPYPIHPAGCGCPACRQTACGCDRCTQHAPCDQPRFLLPRILASGRIHQRCASFTLQPECLPDCLRPPLMLVSVSAGCQTPQWELLPGDRHNEACVHISIPLICRVRDCSGCTFSAPACIETDAVLRLPMPFAECWRANVLVQPCVRMICPPPSSACGCFDVQLEVAAEVWLVRWEAVAAGRKQGC